MSRWNALKKTYRMCTRLRAQRGGSRMAYLLDALRCSVRHGASPENYFVLRFFELTEQQRATYLTSGRSAARDRSGRVRLIGACLKCGGRNAATDNFHSGGVAYPLELASGRVCGPGRNNTDLHDYTRHPASGAYLPGTVIPFWQEITACVSQAMDRVPGMGYVGWDIAVTPDGPELIEGNWHWPGGNIIQFDGVGKYPLLRDCAGETDEQHSHTK